MIKVTYERYHNDHIFCYQTEEFGNLDEFAKWLNSGICCCFSRAVIEKDADKLCSNGSITRERDDYYDTEWVQLIESEQGILFSTGVLTSGRKHISSIISRFANDFNAGKYNFVFVD